MFALARFAGLRTPSETFRLRWDDIDWQNNRFTITSPKTEHHLGKGSRIVPLFPELLPHLRSAFEQANDGSEFVVTRYRDASANLRTQLQRIIKRAGLTPWPKLWQNLRATRATELAQDFPQHVAAAWCGHSAKVAEQHYLQVTTDHYRQAVEARANLASPHARSEPKKATQNPTQHPPARGRIDLPARHKKRFETQQAASQSVQMPGTGVEPARSLTSTATSTRRVCQFRHPG